ncbi:MAG: preprotein translocase subunit SecG [Pikeienuella sp.]
METVLLILHLIIAVCLIAVVLLQKSEGGALGIGGGGGGMVGSRGTGTPLSKVTWGLATAFIATSITLAILAGGNPTGRSVVDEVGLEGDGGLVLPDLPPAPSDEPLDEIPSPATADPLSLPDLSTPGRNQTDPQAPPAAD